MTSKVGLDVDEVRSMGRTMQANAEYLSGTMVPLLDRMVRASSTGWRGPDAQRFVQWWDGTHRARLLDAAERLRTLGAAALTNAADQERASGGSSATTAAGGQRSLPSYADGRAAIVEAFYGTGDSRRAADDEIEIRRLDNGRYIVVLPGVTDLSAAKEPVLEELKDGAVRVVPALGLGFVRGPGPLVGAIVTGGASVAADGVRTALGRWYGNEGPTVRKMRYAMSEATSGRTNDNPYAEVVRREMEAAGVPAGAEVMLVGHSFGAYTAMDLAADRSFNELAGGTGGYQVRVTHVLAAGAETDWRLADLPAGTNAFVLNNRNDAVYRAEDVLHGDDGRERAGNLEVVFSGGTQGVGHHPDNYADFLRSTDRADVRAWLEEAGQRYNAAGTAVSVKVDDPYRSSEVL